MKKNISNGVEAFEGFLKNIVNNPDFRKTKFINYSPVYSFTTENLDSYIRSLDVSNKKVLTVTSSGDQLINLALFNSKEIDCFDINRLCYYYTKLKLALLLNVSYEEFILYFTYCKDTKMINGCSCPVDIDDNCYNYDLYLKVRDKLEPGVKLFFDKLYEYYKYKGIEISSSNLFNNISITAAIFRNTYLASPKNYYEAREKIKKLLDKGSIQFYDLEVLQIHKIKKKYDIVLLSNIYEYIPKNLKEDYAKYIKMTMNSILNPKAKVTTEYQYCGDSRKDKGSIIQNLAICVSSLKNGPYRLTSPDIAVLDNVLGLSLIKVPTIYGELRDSFNIEDCVYVYTNK